MRPLIKLSIGALLLLAVGCYKDADFDPLELDPSEVITELRTAPDVLSANGSATSMITAFLPDDARVDLDVTLTTTSGSFVENSAKTLTVKTKAVQFPEGMRICAAATLRNSNSIGTITVKATLGGYEVSKTLTSLDNPATGIAVVVPSLVMSNNATNEMELTAQLSAASGTVSQGKQVSMEVFDSSSVPRGSFRTVQDRSDAEGKCRFMFSIAPDSLFTGQLTIRAITQGDDTTLEATRTIYITN